MSNDSQISNKMWGGRFSTSPSDIMEGINASISFDKKLYRQDIQGSIVHCQMLAQQKIITQDDANKIVEGLEQVLSEIEQGKLQFSCKLEDIHMNIEARLAEIIGETAGRLHTARSRNDQVATDFKLYIRETITHIKGQIKELQKALCHQAIDNYATIMPGFTHLQTAQPVTFGHHCLAYVEMFARDYSRFSDAQLRLNECPLGAAALAGTSFPIDRHMVAKELGFDRPTRNSLDSVSDRDFALEALSAASITSGHLSRLAEEIVIWSSAQFNYITLSDKYTTGSSIMPQKRNPDAAELVRAKTGRIIGALNSLLIVMKGLPLAYSKDMQEDKEQCFDALENLSLCLSAMTGMVGDLKVVVENMHSSASSGFSTATDIADWLVRVLKMPFRNAHHITGRIVGLAEGKNVGLDDLSLEEMQNIEPSITNDIFSVLSVENSVNSRTSFGGTAPDNVKKSAKEWLEKLE